MGAYILKTLSVDIETFSEINLLKSGCYPYAMHPSFELLLFGYSVDGGPRIVIDVAQGDDVPEEIAEALFDPDVIKRAFNANFEITCLSAHFGRQLPPEQWRCTCVLALTLGMPGHLAAVAEVCKLPVDKQKMGIGKALIMYFCCPVKATKKNGGRTRNYPHHDPAKWALFIEYCGRDVEAEMAVCEKLLRWAPNDTQQALWNLDQRINNRGWKIDLELVKAAIEIDATIKARLTEEFISLTGITKATQVAKIKTWLLDEHELVVESLNKESIKELLKLNDDTTVERVLQLRQQLSKSSVSKYAAMVRSVCSDDRIRGLFQFYGANRTGRWAARLVQAHNLPKSDLAEEDLALARELVKARDIELLQLLFGDVQALLSELIRSAFIPEDDHLFAVVDFSAIEARVVAWGAGCEWRMEVFRTHGRVYEASAAAMFKIPLESIGKKSPLRQKGKISELALGYHGGAGALITMGALKMGIPESELQGLVDAWRAANPEIMAFGRAMEKNAKICLRQKIRTGVPGKYWFRYESGMLFMDLPSGRSLCYVKPRIEKVGSFDNITYDGIDPDIKVWGRAETYAGKLLENWTQAVACDVLGLAMTRLDAVGYPIVGHVHDEVILEVEAATAEASLHSAEEIFAQPISWAPGLPLKGDGFLSPFYKKDA